MPRVSIMLDEKIVERLRMLQAKQIHKTKMTVSFSYVLNRVLEKGLKKF